MNFLGEGRLLKVDEVAKMLRTDPSTVRRRIRAGELVATKPCGHYLVSEGELARFVERARVVAPPQPRQPAQAPPGSFRSRARRGA